MHQRTDLVVRIIASIIHRHRHHYQPSRLLVAVAPLKGGQLLLGASIPFGPAHRLFERMCTIDWLLVRFSFRHLPPEDGVGTADNLML